MTHEEQFFEKLNALSAEAESHGRRWIAEGHRHAVQGNDDRAQNCYEKAKFWFDRCNRLKDKATLSSIKVSRSASLGES